jgi:hypothetical protein
MEGARAGRKGKGEGEEAMDVRGKEWKEGEEGGGGHKMNM